MQLLTRPLTHRRIRLRCNLKDKYLHKKIAHNQTNTRKTKKYVITNHKTTFAVKLKKIGWLDLDALVATRSVIDPRSILSNHRCFLKNSLRSGLDGEKYTYTQCDASLKYFGIWYIFIVGDWSEVTPWFWGQVLVAGEWRIRSKTIGEGGGQYNA